MARAGPLIYLAGSLLVVYALAAGNAGTAFRYRTHVIEAALHGDRELMEYAIYNLLTNAIKYSPSDTQVTVACRPDGNHLRLSIQDQGMGMDTKELRKIFQKFYRTKRAEASGEMGTGIGLSIVDQIVTYHGGRIDVASAPGKGSCFTMVLKASASAPTNEQTIDRRG